MTLESPIEKPLQHNKVEFWAATTIFVFALFSLSTSNWPDRELFEEAGVGGRYYEHYFWPQLIRYTLLYLAFLFLNFKVVPKLLNKERLVLQIGLIVLLYLVVGFVTGILDTYTKGYLLVDKDTEQQTYDFIFQESFRNALGLVVLFCLYTFIKYSGLYLLSNSTVIQSRYRMLTRDTLTAFIVWMVSVFLLLALRVGSEITVVWAFISLSAILLYCFGFYFLIPRSLKSKHPFKKYMLLVFGIMALAYLPVAFLMMLLLNDEDTAFGASMFNSVFQLVVMAPAIWFLFKRQMKGNEELYVLKQELGTTSANLDFLRSQINPHFLFNALNTLYGTALQENSERTAQGIQMLGDMMRFMLHENHQQKILISREIEYMRNYIDLQLLRTSSSPDMVIETKIEDVLERKYIAPMLLIPFVENAFKHGISLKRKSWIRISLHCDQDKLYFDVYNSTHTRSEQDPEKDKSGIGLANVRQRLSLLYPERHELIIRETPEEYFVHLTLQL
ncbi:sensor histidine kinase [Pontibacter roseus]|uniref:sensor histidine kinase n=1 Tax=Pontibacter roseus TaxID=336989 RepID=UPI001FDF097B|nr:histidine kinase [Pontibacter roseus]